MDGPRSLAELDSAYKKVDKWSLKKLEKHYDEERALVSVTRSTIKRLEKINQSYLDKASELVGETVTSETMNKFVEDIREQTIMFELKSLNQLILTTLKDIEGERNRLHHHSLISEMLLKKIKNKSI